MGEDRIHGEDARARRPEQACAVPAALRQSSSDERPGACPLDFHVRRYVVECRTPNKECRMTKLGSRKDPSTFAIPNWTFDIPALWPDVLAQDTWPHRLTAGTAPHVADRLTARGVAHSVKHNRLRDAGLACYRTIERGRACAMRRKTSFNSVEYSATVCPPGILKWMPEVMSATSCIKSASAPAPRLMVTMG